MDSNLDWVAFWLSLIATILFLKTFPPSSSYRAYKNPSLYSLYEKLSYILSVIGVVLVLSKGIAHAIAFYILYGGFSIIPLALFCHVFLSRIERIIFGANDYCRVCGSTRMMIQVNPIRESHYVYYECPDCGVHDQWIPLVIVFIGYRQVLVWLRGFPRWGMRQVESIPQMGDVVGGWHVDGDGVSSVQ